MLSKEDISNEANQIRLGEEFNIKEFIKEDYLVAMDIPIEHKMVESDLEEAIINNIEKFLMELGKDLVL